MIEVIVMGFDMKRVIESQWGVKWVYENKESSNIRVNSLSHGFQKIEVHVDLHVMVITPVSNTKGGTIVGGSLIQNIRQQLTCDWEVRIRHSYREANYCVDTLANLGYDKGFSLIQ